MIRLFWLALFSLAFASSEAVANVGIVVRLVAVDQEVDTPVMVVLTNNSDAVFTLELKDNGTPPDVIAGDELFSGSTTILGTEFTVALGHGGETPAVVGEVSWSESRSARDLIITMSADMLSLETGTGMGGDGGGTRADGSTLPGTGPMAGAGGGPAGGPSTGPAGPLDVAPTGGYPEPSSPEEDATLYIIGGVLLLVLSVIAFIWFRTPAVSTPETAGAGKAPEGAVRLPAPGLLGEGTPSVTDGLSTWIVDPADGEAFLRLTLQSLAQYHRVVVLTEPGVALSAVHGGPVYQAPSERPEDLARIVGGLLDEGGHSLAVLILRASMPSVALDDVQRTVPPGQGIILLTSAPVGEHPVDVRISRTTAGWSLQCKTQVVRLVETAWGLNVESDPSA